MNHSLKIEVAARISAQAAAEARILRGDSRVTGESR
jgi:hypothetical protein